MSASTRSASRLGLVAIAWVLAVGAFAAAATAEASSPRKVAGRPAVASLEAAPEDSPLKMTGVMDAQTRGVTGSVRLTAKGFDIAVLRVEVVAPVVEVVEPVSNNSVGVDALEIPRGNISIGSGTDLKDGVPRDVLVTVKDIPRPGHFTGILRFSSSEKKDLKTSVDVNIEIFARPRPALATALLTLDTCRCPNAISCWIAGFLVSPAITTESREIHLDNATEGRLEIASLSVDVFGKRNGQTAMGALTITPDVVPALGPVQLKARLDRLALPADTYQGTTRVQFKPGGEVLTISTVINVRNGPGWVLLALFLGIVFGIGARMLESPDLKKRIDLRDTLVALDQRAHSIRNQDARKRVLQRITDLMTKVEGTSPTDDLIKEITKQSEQIDLLIELDDLTEDLSAGQVSALGSIIKNARQLILEQKDATAGIATLREAVRANRQDSSMTVEAARLHSVTALLRDVRPRALRVEIAPKVSWWDRSLLALHGPPSVTRFARLVRPAVDLLFLLVIPYFGLMAIYAAAPTFGSGGFSDYVNVAVWGFAAQFSQQAISGLARKA